MSSDIDFASDGSAEVEYLLDSLDGDVTQVTSEKSQGSLGSAVTYTADIQREQNGTTYVGYAHYIASGHDLYGLFVVVAEIPFGEGYDEVLAAMIDSMELDDPQAPSGSDGADDSQETETGDEAVTITAGTYKVGTDIPAGEYKLTAESNTYGYGEVTASSAAAADIIDNDNFEGSTYLTVTDGQYLTIKRCTGILQ